MSARPAPARSLLLHQVCTRIIVSLPGSYVFLWGLLTSGITMSAAAGMEYEEAYTAFRLLAFLLFPLLFLWTFAARKLVQVGAILFGGGAVMTMLAWVLQNQLLQGA